MRTQMWSEMTRTKLNWSPIFRLVTPQDPHQTVCSCRRRGTNPALFINWARPGQDDSAPATARQACSVRWCRGCGQRHTCQMTRSLAVDSQLSTAVCQLSLVFLRSAIRHPSQSQVLGPAQLENYKTHKWIIQSEIRSDLKCV